MAIGGGRVALGALAGAGLFGAVVLAVPPRGVPPEPAPVAAPVAEAPAAPDPAAPGIDAVRLAPDGTGLVAGRAAPGATVSVLAGGEAAAEAIADADGRFVAFLSLPPADAPRELSLDSGGVRSAETVILAPTPAPAAEPVGDVPAQATAVAAPAPDAVATAPEDAAEPPVALAPDAPTPAASDAPAQAPVLLSDASGVRVLQPALGAGADAEVLNTVALDAIAYDGAGEVSLSGRATGADGAVRLYLDGAFLAEAAVGADGAWATALDGVEPGLYALRVDQVDAEGAVTSRIETPFRREARAEVVAAMGRTSPGRGTVAMRTVQPGNTLWAIARDRYDQPEMYVRVFEANRDRIRDPDLIHPGQVFVLPAMDAEAAAP